MARRKLIKEAGVELFHHFCPCLVLSQKSCYRVAQFCPRLSPRYPDLTYFLASLENFQPFRIATQNNLVGPLAFNNDAMHVSAIALIVI